MVKRGVFRQTFLVLGMLFLTAYFAFGESLPVGPNFLNLTSSGRYPNLTIASPIEAQAGNVSSLVIHSTIATEAWQGYYGNVTGKIILADGNNYTFYDWDNPRPKGEVYASNGSGVDWPNIYCMNVSHFRNKGGEGTEDGGNVAYTVNMTQIEQIWGINDTDRDGLNETFNDTYTDATGFTVGPVTIDVLDGCSMAHPYSNETYMDDWQELLLSDNASLVFTAIIRDDGDGFQPGSGDIADFQMLVLENGHTGFESTTTTYYFYVELS